MAKKKKSAKPSVPETQKSVSLDKAKADTENKEAEVGAVKTEPVEQAPMEEEITLSQDTVAEIGEPDKELVFKNVARAYEEAKRKREKYKKIGPIFVLVSGIIFLTLIFTEGTGEESTEDEMVESQPEGSPEAQAAEPQPEGSPEAQAAEPQPEESTEAETPKTVSSKNQQEEKE